MKRTRIFTAGWLIMVAVLAFSSLLFTSCTHGPAKQPYVVVLSLDGFRWDYPQHFSTPNLNRMAEEGVHAQALIPCFPTKTFPSHYSMATGLYPDHHGLIQNSFYDPNVGVFEMTNRQSVENPAFYGGEPIWVTAENQGIRTASYFWVGSEAPVKGKYPSIWKKYDQSVPFTARIDSVIHWLQLPEEKRPHLIMWYIHQPDEISHHEGPLSPATGKMITYLDSLVGVFRARLAELPIGSKINFIVVSDHGMAEVEPGHTLFLDELVPRYWLEGGSGMDMHLNVSAIPAYKDSLYNRLKKIPQLTVWKKEEVPARLHYGTNPRIHDLVVVANKGWNVKFYRTDKEYIGNHGYDNENPDMHGIFYATGPAFKKGYTSKAFENVNLYPLIAHLLKIKPAQVDGSLENVKDLLKD